MSHKYYTVTHITVSDSNDCKNLDYDANEYKNCTWFLKVRTHKSDDCGYDDSKYLRIPRSDITKVKFIKEYNKSEDNAVSLKIYYTQTVGDELHNSLLIISLNPSYQSSHSLYKMKCLYKELSYSS